MARFEVLMQKANPGARDPHLGYHGLLFPSQVGAPGSLLLTDPHLGVVRLWLLLFHVCTVLFKGIVIGIWKPQ